MIAVFKPEKDAGRITKVLRKQSGSFNIERVSFPMGKDDMIRLSRQNNVRVHCVCAMTNNE